MQSPAAKNTPTTVTPSTPPRICDVAASLESIRLVTFNVAGCVPSKEAPSSWDTTIATGAIVEEVTKSDPDILALQECPTRDHTKLLQTFPSYQVIGTTPSHADYVVLLVKKGIHARVVPTTALGVRGEGVPMVLAELSYPEKRNRKILVASVHLAPFKGGSKKREEQVGALLQHARDAGVPIVLAGDTNMRESEDDAMEDELGLSDAWKVAGSNLETKFTWDTNDHTTTGTTVGTVNGSFNRYYGNSTRQYNARYDRIYFFSDQKSLVEVGVDSFELIANHPLTNPYHFLSDHFGISTVLSLKWKEH